jgi:hypothetical protein
MEEAGFQRWRPHTFFEGWNGDGTMRTREGFKNTLTDQEITPPAGWNADLGNLDHGDIACVQHSGDAYREGWERIWGQKENQDAIKTG